MALWLTEDFLSVELGLALWGLSYWVPLRRFSISPEYVWDGVGAICAVLFATGATIILDQAYDWATDFDWIGQWQEGILALSSWQLLLLNIVCVDFAVYWGHRLLHTRYLWPSHAWHHSPRVLYWLAGLRGSPIHMLILYAPATLVFVFVPTPETGAVALATTVVDVANQHFIHSNIRVPWARQLEWVFVTPRMHFVHHSAVLERANSNYGFVFSLWDRLFGTYTDPDTVPADDPLGLGYEQSRWQLLFGLPQRAARALSSGDEQAAKV